MAGMIDLKRRKSDPEDKAYFATGSAPSPDSQKDYYPISMWLCKPEVDALGLADVKVGQEFDMAIHVRVTSKSQNESDDGWNDRNVTLTVMAAKVENETGKDPDEVAGRLYDNKETD